MIGIIDYGAGNLFSVQNALNHLEIENCIAENEADIRRADALILPGVGAFPDAMKMLKQKNWIRLSVRKQRKNHFSESVSECSFYLNQAVSFRRQKDWV